jgi:hypothetical protein
VYVGCTDHPLQDSVLSEQRSSCARGFLQGCQILWRRRAAITVLHCCWVSYNRQHKSLTSAGIESSCSPSVSSCCSCAQACVYGADRAPAERRWCLKAAICCGSTAVTTWLDHLIKNTALTGSLRLRRGSYLRPLCWRAWLQAGCWMDMVACVHAVLAYKAHGPWT